MHLRCGCIPLTKQQHRRASSKAAPAAAVVIRFLHTYGPGQRNCNVGCGAIEWRAKVTQSMGCPETAPLHLDHGTKSSGQKSPLHYTVLSLKKFVNLLLLDNLHKEPRWWKTTDSKHRGRGHQQSVDHRQQLQVPNPPMPVLAVMRCVI